MEHSHCCSNCFLSRHKRGAMVAAKVIHLTAMVMIMQCYAYSLGNPSYCTEAMLHLQPWRSILYHPQRLGPCVDIAFVGNDETQIAGQRLLVDDTRAPAVAYVVFKEAASVQAALAANMCEVANMYKTRAQPGAGQRAVAHAANVCEVL
eukprot:1159311-Pelagomonas_calceolata.AAC.4